MTVNYEPESLLSTLFRCDGSVLPKVFWRALVAGIIGLVIQLLFFFSCNPDSPIDGATKSYWSRTILSCTTKPPYMTSFIGPNIDMVRVVGFRCARAPSRPALTDLPLRALHSSLPVLACDGLSWAHAHRSTSARASLLLACAQHVYIGVVVGLLLVFRTNISYSRYDIGVTMVGRFRTSVRNLMMQCSCYIDGLNPDLSHNPREIELRDEIRELMTLMLITVQFHVGPDRQSDNEPLTSIRTIPNIAMLCGENNVDIDLQKAYDSYVAHDDTAQCDITPTEFRNREREKAVDFLDGEKHVDESAMREESGRCCVARRSGKRTQVEGQLPLRAAHHNRPMLVAHWIRKRLLEAVRSARSRLFHLRLFHVDGARLFVEAGRPAWLFRSPSSNLSSPRSLLPTNERLERRPARPSACAHRERTAHAGDDHG